MTVVVTLSPELEALLLDKAAQQGKDVSLIVSELLSSVLEWEIQDSEEAIKGIQEGLNDFDLGCSQSFQEFAEEQRRKYNLPSAEDCFRQGWYEAMTGQTIPLSELWEGIDAEISDSEPLPSPEESFRQAWQEIKTGNTRPVSELWDGIDAE